MSSRQSHYDFLRIFSTLAVITLHSTSKQWYLSEVGSEEFLVFNFYESLVRWSVPVFFMLSGMLFLNPEKELSMKKMWTKNIPRLAVAFFFWSCVYARVHYLRGSVVFEEPSFHLRLLNGNYHQGFIVILLGLYVCLPVFRQIAKDQKTLEYFLRTAFICGLVGNFLMIQEDIAYFLQPTLDKMDVTVVLGYGVYFLLGYYLHQFPPTFWEKFLLFLLALMSVCLTYFGTEYLSGVEESAVDSMYLYLLPTTFFISIGVFLLFQLLEGKISERWGYVLYQLSSLSFGIYLCHDLFLLLLLEDRFWIYWDISPVLSVPLFTMVVYGLSALLVYVISWIPVVNRMII